MKYHRSVPDPRSRLGAVYAALALGLVVTYRSSGVVNLASGAVALYIAYTYAYLRMGQAGRPDTRPRPDAASAPGRWGFWPAFLISLAVGPSRRAALRAHLPAAAGAPAAAKAVARSGSMIVLQALLATRLGSAAATVAPIFPVHAYQILGSRVPGDRLWSAAIIVLVAAALALWFGSPGSAWPPGRRPSRRRAPSSPASRRSASRW